MTIEHILLTTDFSEDARRAYAPTTELAHSIGARITLLHLVPVLCKAPPEAAMAQPLVIGNLTAETGDAELAIAKERELLEGVKVETSVVAADTVANGVVEYARGNEVDLIAISSHGRSGIRRMVMGSVAELILRHADVPVLCFPPKH